MAAFADAAGLRGGVDLLDPVVLPGLLLGAMLPFVFAALTMLSVGKAAESIMWECRDQLNKRWESGTALDPAKCIRISTVSSIREMMAPGTLAVFAPVVTGFVLGTKGLLGLLAGAISAGFLLAVTMANAGGAWDNAKKYVEKGNLGPDKGKKSANHKAVVVGDTVGDPFKDTSGPALNILIKLMSIVSLVLTPAFTSTAWENWWVGLILTIAYIFGGVIYQVKFGGQNLHDKRAIDEVSAKRKADPREKQAREERQAKKSGGGHEEKKQAPTSSSDEPDPFEAQGSAKAN
jgi:K(+)-stimulated pyrophosphate-energized sodium pump